MARAAHPEPARSGRTLWVTVGQSTIPIVLAVLALEPDEVVPICTQETRSTLDEIRAGVDEALRRRSRARRPRWRRAVVVPADDPAGIRSALEQADLPPGDLAYAGGTAAMVAVTHDVWSKTRPGPVGEPRAWYLADRAGELRAGDGTVVRLADSPYLRSSLTDVLTIRGRADVNIETRYRVDLAPGTTLDRLDPDWPFTEASERPGALEVLAALGWHLLTNEQARPETVEELQRRWNDSVPGLPLARPATPRGLGHLSGIVLEHLTFAIVARLLAATPRRHLPVWLSIGVTIANDPTANDAELDVVVVSGPRVTVVSCGISPNRGVLTSRFFEAKGRAGSLVGSEARSLTLALRSGRALAADPAAAERQMDIHRKALDLDAQPDRDRHRLAAPLELFTGASHRDLFADLRDPRTRLTNGRSRQRELASFIARSCFP
ncbi:hypothetical protein [Rhabdothermincola sp.]|uniref:hypothetical protein n=1 Tax=Rhabdothermincola sp. TaxID=2820405 RepID=UPI002FDF3BD1